MAVIPGRILLTMKEAAYLAYHVGFRPPLLQIRIAIDDDESLLDTGAYRPASENSQGGIDWGFEMENDVNGPFKAAPKKGAPGEPNPFRFLEPIFSLRKSFTYAQANPTTPFKPWGYPTVRSDADIELADITAQIGPIAQLYTAQNSPYWRMKAAGIPVEDLPVPPAMLYVSRLPAPPMSIGGYPDGRANALQRIYAEMGRYPLTALDNYYGNKTAGNAPYTGGTKSIQRDLTTCGLWAGPIDGIYSVALHKVWDGLLRFQFMTKGAT